MRGLRSCIMTSENLFFTADLIIPVIAIVKIFHAHYEIS